MLTSLVFKGAFLFELKLIFLGEKNQYFSNYSQLKKGVVKINYELVDKNKFSFKYLMLFRILVSNNKNIIKFYLATFIALENKNTHTQEQQQQQQQQQHKY